MDIADVATKALKVVIANNAKKVRKTVKEPVCTNKPYYMKNTSDEYFNAGFASLEVVPDDIDRKTYYLAGYQMNQHVTGILDPTTVNAMWLDCKDNGGIVLISADIIGFTGYEVRLLRTSLADFIKMSGCKSINVSSTHSHASIDTVGYWGQLPKTGKDKAYMEKLLKSMKEAVISAYENRREGKLYIGSVRVPDAISDGRPPYVCNDRLTRLRFVPNDGTPETWFLNYGAHPNTMGKPNSKISADYPYFIRKTVNEAKKTNILFSVNAIAGVNIADLAEDRLERTRLAGEMLGKAALNIDNDKQLSPEITVCNRPYVTPIDNYVLALMSVIHAVNSLKVPCDKGTVGMGLLTEMVYLKIGSQQILMLPGEALPEFAYGGYASAEESATGMGPEVNGPTLVDIADDKDLLIFGVTNDMTGYMVPKNDFILHPTQAYLSSYHDRFDRNHYHETNSLGTLVTDTVAQVFADILDNVNK